jgi:DNA-binding MarR family transcriptional regulator
MPAPSDSPLSDAGRALNALRRFVRALRTASRDSERRHAVTAAQLYVLRELGTTPGLSLGALARRTHTTQSTVSEVVARLVEAGLVRRRTAAADARRRELSLTARGRTIVRDAPRSMPERLLDAFDTLPAARRAALVAGLEEWLDASGLGAGPAPMFFERRRARADRA